MQTGPRTVPVVAVFLFGATVIATVVGLSLLFPNPLLDHLWVLNPAGAVFFHSLGRISGVFLLALAAAMFAAARGLLRGELWAWWFATTLFVVEALSNLANFFLVHDALRAVTGFVISAAFLFALSRRDVREQFFRSQ